MKILIPGEIYPEVIHGVSIANFTNSQILKSRGNHRIIIINEKSDINKIGLVSFNKGIQLCQFLIKISKETSKNKPEILYKPVSISIPGIIKDFLMIVTAKIGFGKIRVILHLHRGDLELKLKENKIFYHLFMLVIKLSDTLIVLSEGQFKNLQYLNRFIDLKVLENTISPIDEPLISFHQNEYKFKSHYDFLYVSNYFKEKGINELIAAFTKINSSLKCYGSGTRPKINRKNIKIHGPIFGKKKYNSLSTCQALILPSYNEGQPTVIIEAMAVGTIILTTKVGLIEELLGTDYPFYFNTMDVRDLLRCVEKFNNYSDKEQLSKKLRKKYKTLYSNEIHEQKLLSIFNLT